MTEVIVFRVGQPYPLPIIKDGAAAQFLVKSHSTLQIMLYDIMASERKLLKSSKMQAGLIIDQPMILFVVQFGDLIFECPFDIRLISPERRELDNITNERERLFIDMHIVDMKTKKLEILRGITLTPELTRKLYAAAKVQANTTGDFDKIYAKYSHLSMEQLVEFAQMSVCGE